jgi:phospholipid/cholesterol/gamma-HCH transport system ATP-binding protein
MQFLPFAPTRWVSDAMNAPDLKLRVERLSVGYASRVVQHDVSFEVFAGSIFAIMGGSGSGKSTLLQALIGLLRPSAGRVCFGAEDYWAAAEARRTDISRRFGVLFQSGALWSSMTAAQNVALPLQMFTKLDPASIDALVQLKLSLVGLDVGRDSMPASLSGGMIKRVGLARALSLEPDMLFLDEPSAGLDPGSAKRLDDLILDLCHGLGVTVVLVSHDLESLLNICDDGIFLDTDTSTAIAHGAPKALREQCDIPSVRAFMNRERPPGIGVANGVRSGR